MSKLPVHRAERAPRKVEQDVVEVLEPASRANPFFSFHSKQGCSLYSLRP